MSNLFSAGSSKARRLGALSTLAVSALLFSACEFFVGYLLGERFRQRIFDSVLFRCWCAGFGLVQPQLRSGRIRC